MSGMTMTQKLLAEHAGLDSVHAGQIIEVKLDMVLGNDITAPVAIKQFNEAGAVSVFDPKKIALVLDHFTPNKDIKAAEQCKLVRDFALRFAIENFFDVGRAGIEHALLPEQGIVTAGECIIGADSHTCTYGALGAFSTGVGSTDMAAAMITGKAWLKVPSAIRVELGGALPSTVFGKDVILYLLGQIGVDGALYSSLEFCGDGVKALSMSDRLCIANMAVETGAKNGIFPVDSVTEDYIASHGNRRFKSYTADNNAEYVKTVHIELSEMKPMIAFPSLPSNVRAVDELQGTESIPIDQVVIGSCTNGRIEDLRIAARVLRGNRVAPGTRTIIIPATQKVYLDALREGLIETFINAGAVVSTPTCGPCLGGHTGVLAAGERCVATTNRNFTGRMGEKTSEVYLASPYTAAKCAISGKI